MLMSSKELKEEINKVLDGVPEEVLESVLLYLKELLAESKPDPVLLNRINRILREDKELLGRLAK